MGGSRNDGQGGAAPAGMRAPIKWALAGTVLATAASLLWPNRGVVAVEDRVAASPLPTHAPPAADPGPATTHPSAASASLPVASAPSAGERASAAAATDVFDPFVGVLPPPPPAPPVPMAASIVAAPPPAPPAQDFRFLGRIRGPDGTEHLLLVRGDTSVTIQVGMTLDNGYVVQSISADAVELVYPPLGVRSTIPIGASTAAP